jgi:diguanylate cyclase (GGDEF)-like protein
MGIRYGPARPVPFSDQITPDWLNTVYLIRMTLPQLNLSAIPDSLYGAELQRTSSNLRFASPELEAEYLCADLIENRTIIRIMCTLAVLLSVFRGVRQAVAGSEHGIFPIELGFIIAISILLASIAWSPLFERRYPQFARVLVPMRSAIAAAYFAEVAAHGQPEMLMVLPGLLVGPFFFLGLRYHTALCTGALVLVSFAGGAMFFHLGLPIALRGCAFLFMGMIACAIAARHLEISTRTTFLQTRVIAELAQHDALTGAKNRRVFDEYLTRLWQQSMEDGRAIALLLIDVDHFKAYNDRYGHQAGDQVLRRVAQALQALVSRPLDVLARYGGEEFSVILYDVDTTQAMDFATRIHRAVGDLGIEHQGCGTSARLTISVGVAAIHPTPRRNPRGALQLADQALYEAKAKGRNRVELMNDVEHGMMVTGAFSKEALARR